jgi:hypothetical protein
MTPLLEWLQSLTFGDWMQLTQTVCVVGALIGLVAQLRFTAKVVRADAYQGLVAQVEALHERIAGQTEDAQILKEAIAPKLDIHPRQLVLALSLLNLLESAHFQYTSGVIPSPLWQGWQQQMDSYFKLPFFREVWERNRAAYNPDFRALLDAAAARAASYDVDLARGAA